MSNIINSHINNDNNLIAAKKISENSSTRKPIGPIEAPASIPNFSIYKVIQEKDEFRKNTIAQNYINNEKSKKRKGNLLKLGIIISAVAGYFLLKRKA